MIALIGGILMGITLLTVLIVFLYRLLTRNAAPPLSPSQIARRRLTDLESRAASLTPNEFSVAVSDTLKDYLVQRFGDPVRYETSEEFLQRLSQAKANALPAATREAVANFLVVADEIKYGRPPDAEARKLPLLDQAREVIQDEPDSAVPKAGSTATKRRHAVQ